ncbi:MAG: hypothetical protein V2A79_03335 [Planctomycetota bacterium]
MRYNFIFSVLAGLWLCVGGASAAEPPGFAQPPSAKASGDKITISFSVKAPCDAAVWVEDGAGKIVRHIAAGLLGDKSPEPFQKGLAQSIEWDRKDDAGKPVLSGVEGPAPAGCKVKVGLGLGATFDKVLGWQPQNIGGVLGLATDSKGNVCVLNFSDFASRSSPVIQVFSRDGTYVKTLMPWPADVPFEKVNPLWAEVSPAERIPRVFHTFQCLYPETANTAGQGMCVAGGTLVFASVRADTSVSQAPRLLRLSIADGAPPEEGYMGTPLVAFKMMGAFVHLAASPDGKIIYATGLVGPKEWVSNPQHVVTSMGLNDKEPGKVLIGEPYKAGKDEKHLNDPRGVATDGQGNIYVADYGNDRIAVFSPDGTFIGALDVPAPGPLAVDARRGAIFVVSGAVKGGSAKGEGGKLLRFASWKGGARGELALAKNAVHVLAVDASAEPAVLWMGSARESGTGELIRIEDGETLRPEVVAASRASGLVRPMYITADREREEIYVRDWAHGKMLRLKAGGGAPEALPFDAAEVAIDREGRVYAITGGYQVDAKVARFTREGQPAPFAGDGNAITIPGTIRGGHMRGVRGLTIAPDGDLYALRFQGHQDKDKDWDTVVLDVYGPDGKAKRQNVVTLTAGAGGVRVDRAGNIYVSEHLMPKDLPIPAAFSTLPPAERRPYGGICGSILKFGTAGGKATWYQKNPPEEGVSAIGFVYAQPQGFFRITGELRGIFPGIAPVGQGKMGLGCTCFTSRFDMDGFDRLFVPDAARFSVRALDTEGNEIFRIGTYGNADSAGPGSKIPEPEIAFAWPAYVAVTDQAVYVSDMLNRRVLRAKLIYATMAECSEP